MKLQESVLRSMPISQTSFFHFLGARIWGTSGIERRTSVQLLKSIFSSVSMFGCEVRKLTKTETKTLHGLQYKCMKRFLRIIGLRTSPTNKSRRTQVKKMELNWSYNEERQRGTLRHSFGVEA